MSRMQNILDRAERDGALRVRVRTDAVPPPSPVPAALMPPAGSPLDYEQPIPARPVSGARLDARLVAVSAPNSTAAEQYRALRTRLARADEIGPSTIILVTSPTHGDGKSLTAANLGLTMAQESHRRICVVDANLRNPSQHQLFGLVQSPGLSDVLEGRATIEQVMVALDEYSLSIVPSGAVPAHPAELLGTAGMRRLLQMLRSSFDCVIVDAPGAAPLADVGVLAPLVDGVLVVVRAGKTAKPAIHDTVASLDGRVLGVVLNDIV
jgi:polysaccharide biosynthesis transport protein